MSLNYNNNNNSNNNEGTYFIKVNSTYSPLLLVLNQVSQVVKTE